MSINRKIHSQLLSVALLGLFSATSFASLPDWFSSPVNPPAWDNVLLTLENLHSKKSIQLGGFFASQGQAQNININDLIGDHFSVNNATEANGLVGVGYYLDGQEIDRLMLSYGVNVLYLARTSVNGLVTKEQLFTNLSYRYSITNYPIYFGAKAWIKNEWSDKFNVTLDAGIGPNIISTTSVNEISLDGITLPDKTYSGQTTATFSAMAGIGIKLNNVFGHAPLECGYRFFYLGQGQFNKLSDQLLNTLTTGNGYANALLCTITV